jgi:uncharacterized iron-regulated protein
MLTRAAIVCLALLLADIPAAIAASPTVEALQRFTWMVPLLKDHPLAGRIWSPRAKDFIDHAALVEAVAGAPLVLLGEMHDNADHHRLRAVLLPLSKALVFEQIREDQREGLARFEEFSRRARRLATGDDLMRFLDWKSSSWSLSYEPLLQAAVRSRLPILPGDISREAIRSAARTGEPAITPEERQRLGLDAALSPDAQDALLTELEASHCGVMPKSAFGNMAFAQRYRDAHLARALADAAVAHGSAMLLAGNGHVRKDRGVPWHLERMAPGKAVVVVMLIEVEDGKSEPSAYPDAVSGDRAFADFVVFTPRAQREDPCARMREQAKKKSASPP